MNSKDLGNYGVSLCTTYFLSKGYRVLTPYGDCGHYDLVVENDGKFQRIQCKYRSSTSKPHGYVQVSLSVSGSKLKENGGVTRNNVYVYKKRDFDLLWVATLNTCYLIPFSEVLNGRESKTDLKLYPKWDKYRVSVPIPFPSDNENEMKRPSPRLTSSDKSTIKRLIKEGKTQSEIADILCVTRSCISVYLCRSNKK